MSGDKANQYFDVQFEMRIALARVEGHAAGRREGLEEAICKLREWANGYPAYVYSLHEAADKLRALLAQSPPADGMFTENERAGLESGVASVEAAAIHSAHERMFGPRPIPDPARAVAERIVGRLDDRIKGTRGGPVLKELRLLRADLASEFLPAEKERDRG